MAESCCTYMHEMDDVHRWLPSEILGDIGISESDTAERRRVAVVEDLAVRLAGVLGGGAGEMAAPCHRPQVRGGAAADPRHANHHAPAAAARPHTNVPPSQCRAQRHRRGNEAAAAMARRQQELRQAMAANVAQMQQLAVPGAPAPSCPDLALPQEWTY
uniref:Uncharacterized protein n=1 Tax=Oryza brachyantha TaxID=4533 RepID=J3LNT4_ORYBR